MTAYFTDICRKNGQNFSQLQRISRDEIVFVNDGRIYLVLQRKDSDAKYNTDYDSVRLNLTRFLTNNPIKETLRKLKEEDHFDGALLDMICEAIIDSDEFEEKMKKTIFNPNTIRSLA